MEKIKHLNQYQKLILLFTIVATLVFAVIYFLTISRVGYRYMDSIFVPAQQNGGTAYSGKLHGEQAYFNVSENQTVTFQYGDKTYGPYTVTEDPTAIPKNVDPSEHLTGIEIHDGDDILFRGAISRDSDPYWIYDEDGSLEMFRLSYVDSDGTERDENDNVIDPIAPSVPVILELLHGPELTHKGAWIAWFAAVLICILNAVSMIFADQIFRFGLSFQIRGADTAEPSDWEIIGRYISWIVLAVVAMAIFVIGLQ